MVINSCFLFGNIHIYFWTLHQIQFQLVTYIVVEYWAKLCIHGDNQISYHGAKEDNCYGAGDHHRIASQLCMARSCKLQMFIKMCHLLSDKKLIKQEHYKL